MSSHGSIEHGGDIGAHLVKDLLAKKLSRRQFVRAVTGSAAAGIGTAVLQESGARIPETEIGADLEIPGHYSEIIRSYDLRPRIIPIAEGESAVALLQRKIGAGVKYIEKLSVLFEDLSNGNNLPPLKDTLFNGEGPHYPIALSGDWDLSSFVMNAHREISSGKAKVIPNSSYDGLMGTINVITFDRDTQKLARKTNIYGGTYLADNNQYLMDKTRAYLGYTDLEVALLIYHEVAHGLQGEMILQNIERDFDADKLSKMTDQEIRDEIKNRFKKRQDEMNSTHNPEGLFEGAIVLYNEAQANLLHLSILYYLNMLNGSTHFPGTGYVHPSPEQVRLDIRQDLGSHDKLYPTFLRSIIAHKNPYDNSWLKLHVAQ